MLTETKVFGAKTRETGEIRNFHLYTVRAVLSDINVVVS